ncbi:MAG: hypothetical protein HOP17_13230 [Acidobacteria bacterium]|nr:hypothetical protein [Acidobacteriota bacterium]
MSEKCFEIGAIQAFLDGETTPELSFAITEHSAKCDSCALLIAEAEEENAQVFAMLDRELNSLVPTQRLWSNITVALAEERNQASFWDKARGYVFALFANPSLGVAASVLVVAGLFAAVWSLKSPVTNGPGSDVVAVNTAQPQVPQTGRTEKVNTTVSGGDPVSPTSNDPVRVRETNFSPRDLKNLVSNANHSAADQPVKPVHAVVREPAAEQYLPGEESYIKTISNLKQNVDGRKDLILDPSSRMAYERDIAVVNDSIKRMKDVVRKNPKNQAAKQVLYSSYQNKIDLLNSVVEREELMAALQ